MSEATEMLAAYTAAEKAVLKNQSYSIDGISYNKADLGALRAGRQEWQRRVNTERARLGGGSSVNSVADFTN